MKEAVSKGTPQGRLQCHADARHVDAALIDTNEAALDMMETLVKEMAEAEGVTEQLKRTDQVEWVRRMNGIRNRAEEIVRSEFIAC